MLLPTILISLVFSFSAAQKLIPLSSFKGGNVNNSLNYTLPFAIYVSAFSDDSRLLQQISVTTEDNTTMTLADLKNNKYNVDSGDLYPYTLTTKASLVSALGDEAMSSLTGLMFVSTTNQIYDATFTVYDVDRRQVIELIGLVGGSTTVFLNTNLETSIPRSSTISGWSQTGDATVYMYKGVPGDDIESPGSQIFSNPIQTGNDSFLWVPTVEQFSISLEAFYIKSHKDLFFTIQPRYYNFDGLGTNDFSTTGLYMKTKDQTDRSVTLSCFRDTDYNGTTGANVIGSLPLLNGAVVIQEIDNTQNQSVSVHPSATVFRWSTPNIGLNLTISTERSDGGELFVQYFISQGVRVATSTPLSTTLATTTSSSSTSTPSLTTLATTTSSSSTSKFIGKLFPFLMYSNFLFIRISL